MDEKEITAAIRDADGNILYRADLRVKVEKAVVGKWISIDLSDLPTIKDGDALDIWTGTICD